MGRSGAQYGQLGAANTWTGAQTFFGGIRANGIKPNVQAKAANYIATVNDVVVLASAAGGAITISLPLSQFPSGLWMVKKTDATANAVTVQGVTGNIDGAATFVLAAQNSAVIVASDGVNGWVMGKV